MYVARTEDFNPTHIVQVPHISYTIHIAAYSVNEKICKGHCNERTAGCLHGLEPRYFRTADSFMLGPARRDARKGRSIAS